MTDANEKAVWYCLRSKTKREHIAAAFVSQQCTVEVFSPRVALWRKTRQGRKLFVEALFPGYFFSRFAWGSSGRHVLATQGVTGIVRFGPKVPEVPDAVINDLRSAIDEMGPSEGQSKGLEEGELVEILTGCFRGSTAKVAQAVDGSGRVAVLIEFLGRSLTLNIERSEVLACEGNTISVPERFLRSGSSRI